MTAHMSVCPVAAVMACTSAVRWSATLSGMGGSPSVLMHHMSSRAVANRILSGAAGASKAVSELAEPDGSDDAEGSDVRLLVRTAGPDDDDDDDEDWDER